MISVQEKQSKKCVGKTSLELTFDYRPELVSLMKTMSGCFFDKETKTWEVPIAYLDRVIEDFSFYDEVDVSLLKEEETKENEIVLDTSRYKTKPFPYQEEAIKFGLSHDKWLLLDAPGLGKTLTLILLAQELKERYGLEHCLIICGINGLKSNWKNEIEKHSSLSCRILGQKVSKKGKVSIGSVKDRLEQLKNPIDEFFVITNIETLRDDDITKTLIKGKKNKFDMIVVDEVHTCKSSQSTQGSNLLKLNKAKWRVAATGTMIMNSPLDSYVPLKWIGEENSSFTNFKYFYCILTGPFNNIISGFKNMDNLKNQLSKCSLRRTKDLLDLPPKTIIDEYVELEDRQALFYENVQQGVLDEVDKVELNTTSLLGMVTRLRQATACPSILTSENIPSAKIERACELVDEIVSNGSKVVIFSTYKRTVCELAEKLEKYHPYISTGDDNEVDVAENIKKFQNTDEGRVFIGTWQKVGTGITLTSASYMIWIDTPWTYSVFEQGCDRIYRIGTKDSVFIYNLITKDTIDERVAEILNTKEALGDFIIDDKVSDKSLDSLRKYITDLR